MSEQRLNFAVVILAAGESSRMGRPKLLLPWGETTILGHLVRQWRALGAQQVAVVCRPGDGALVEEFKRLAFEEGDWIENPRPGKGMFGSVQAAARWDAWRQGITHFVISLGDQPQIQRKTLSGLLRFAAENPGMICQPGLAGRAKHPVVIPAVDFRNLARTGASTMREFLETRCERLRLWESRDEGLRIDLDTPEDYDDARRRFSVESD